MKEFTITNAEQFAGFLMLRANGGGKITFEGVTIKLARDLIINQGSIEDYVGSGITPQSLPALNSNYEFRGTFDGQGHTISGVYLQCTTSGIKGLFGGLGDNAVIKDLTLDNCYAGSANVATKNTLGILAAKVIGQNVTISGVKITNMYMKESTESFYGIGAIVGRVDATATLTLENCEVTGKIDFGTKGTRIGSLIGYVASDAKTKVTVNNCTAKVDITGLDACGGLIGEKYVNSTVTFDDKCSFTGTITCPGTKGDLLGKAS